MHANGGSAAKFGHYLFRDCINLATFVLQEDGRQQEAQPQAAARELPMGCLSSTGITTLELTRDFHVLGAHACDNCKLLQQVNIPNSSVEEIQEFTFVHCVSLPEVNLPYSLHTIRVRYWQNLLFRPHCITLPVGLSWIAHHCISYHEDPTLLLASGLVQTTCGRRRTCRLYITLCPASVLYVIL